MMERAEPAEGRLMLGIVLIAEALSACVTAPSVNSLDENLRYRMEAFLQSSEPPPLFVEVTRLRRELEESQSARARLADPVQDARNSEEPGEMFPVEVVL